MTDFSRIPEHRRYGRVASVMGMLLEIAGAPGTLTVGGRCDVVGRDGKRLSCEIIGFRNGRALAMPFGPLDGVGLGCKAEVALGGAVVYPHESWLGRVVNAMGEPIDGKGA